MIPLEPFEPSHQLWSQPSFGPVDPPAGTAVCPHSQCRFLCYQGIEATCFLKPRAVEATSFLRPRAIEATCSLKARAHHVLLEATSLLSKSFNVQLSYPCIH